jgi:hypothetical protein
MLTYYDLWWQVIAQVVIELNEAAANEMRTLIKEVCAIGCACWCVCVWCVCVCVFGVCVCVCVCVCVYSSPSLMRRTRWMKPARSTPPSIR